MLLYLRVLDQRRLSWTKMMPSTQAIIFVPSRKATLRSSSMQVMLEVTRQLFGGHRQQTYLINQTLGGRLVRALRARAGICSLLTNRIFQITVT